MLIGLYKKLRAEGFFKQLFRYAAVGCSGFLIEFGVFNLLLFLLPEEMSFPIKSVSIAHTAGFLSGAAWTFVLNKFWSFGTRENTAAQSVKYAALLLFNLFVTNALLLYAAEHLGLSEQISKLGIMVLVAGWNFFISKYFVYAKRRSKGGEKC